jgi:hypothetical protein
MSTIDDLYTTAYTTMVELIFEYLIKLPEINNTNLHNAKTQALNIQTITKVKENLVRKHGEDNTQEWGYLCSDLMDLINQGNVSGFSLYDSSGFNLTGEPVISNEKTVLDLAADFVDGEKWNNKIRDQLLSFVPNKSTKTTEKQNFLIMCSEQYTLGGDTGGINNSNEFSYMDNNSKTNENLHNQMSSLSFGSNKVYNSYVKRDILGSTYYFVNFHNSSGSKDTVAASDLINFIKNNVTTEYLKNTIFGGDSNCYYAPFGTKTGIKGIQELTNTFKTTHDVYISRYAIAKYRPNNFLLNSQTMTKGGKTDFEETMFMMIPREISVTLSPDPAEHGNPAYIKVKPNNSGINILETKFLVGFNGVFKPNGQPVIPKLPPRDSGIGVFPRYSYFSTHLLSDHVPIMATLTFKKVIDGTENTEDLFLVFSNNLSIQGSRGFKGRSNVWNVDLPKPKLTEVNEGISQEVLKVLKVLSPHNVEEHTIMENIRKRNNGKVIMNEISSKIHQLNKLSVITSHKSAGGKLNKKTSRQRRNRSSRHRRNRSRKTRRNQSRQ